MKSMRYLFFVILFSLLGAFSAQAQCVLNDGGGNPVANPVWVSCSGGAFTLFIQSPGTFGPYSIDWGDGSPLTFGAALVPPNFVSHNYAAAITTYTVTFTETGSGCVVTGTLVMEEPVNASLQIPIGGVTQICAPGAMLFTNASTDVSSTTTFTWDFGDGSPQLTFGNTNAGQTISHTYQPNTVNCITQVTLEAENFCSFGNPTVATFNPIQIYDIDDAAITPSALLLCYPDTVVHFNNTTNRNCVPEGNITQRFEYWNFGNYWGTGMDSIIDWQPFEPPTRPGYDIAFPGLGSYTIMLIDSSLCGLDTAFVTVNIVPPPTAALSASDDTICAGESVTFNNLSTGGATAYAWNFGDGSGWMNTGGGNQNHTFNVTGTVTIRLVANIAGAAACTDTVSFDLEVNPSPQAGFNFAPGVGCDSIQVTFTDASFGAVSWDWTFGNGDTSTQQNPPPVDYVGANGYNVNLLVTALNGCTDTEQQTVTLYQSPVGAFSPANVCEDVLSQFTDNSTFALGDPVVSWDWDFGDPPATSTQQNPTHMYTDSGTYTVRLIVNTANCVDTVIVPLVVEPRPIAGFTIDTIDGCSPLAVNFTNTTIGAVNYSWDFGDGTTSTLPTPSHVFVNNTNFDTTYVVRLVAQTTFGCTDTIYDTVSVYPIPTAAFTSNAILDCAPLIVSFTENSIGALSYAWDFGDSSGSNLPNPTHIFQNQSLFITNYTVDLVITSNNGCTDTASQVVTVYPEPIFGFSSNPDSGCSPLVVSFPSVIGAVTYLWDFDDGTTGTGPTPVHTFTNTTTNDSVYNVQLIATSGFGCSDTTLGPIIVHPNPASIISSDINVGCHPLTVNFQNTSTGGANFVWDFDDGDTSQSSAAAIAHTFTNTTNDTVVYDARLIVESADGCMDTAIIPITVYPEILAGFDATVIQGCTPLSVQMLDTSTNVAIYSWDFGDGTTGSNSALPSHIFVNSGATTVTYTVTQIVTSTEGCLDTATIDITVFPKPAALVVPDVVVGCHPLVVTFQNNSTSASIYAWEFDDGSVSTSGAASLVHTFDNTTNDTLFFDTELIVESVDGCRDTVVVPITVYPDIIAGFTADVEQGCTPLVVQFTDTSTNTATYTWDFGDGSPFSNAVSPSYTFTNFTNTTVIYEVKQIVTTTEGCQDSSTLNITVYPSPVAQISPNVTVGCQPLIVSIQNQSSLQVSNAWTFGDGALSSSNAGTISHTYSNLGSAPVIYPLSLIVTSIDGCMDTAQQDIEVYPLVLASFTSDTVGCSPVTVAFNDASIGVNQYDWTFGDGSLTSNTPAPAHTYFNAGLTDTVYTVELTVTSIEGCTHDTTGTVLVHPKPLASFNAPPNVCHLEPITFTNNSVINDTNRWHFGFGDSLIDNSPTVDTSYMNFNPSPTSFIVTLEVQTVYGCRDTAIHALQVFPEILADFALPESACSPLTTVIANQSIGATSYNWVFSDGGFDVVPAPTHTFVNNSTVDLIGTVSLTVTSLYGCTNQLIDTIVIHPTPNASFLPAPVNQRWPDSTVSVTNGTNTGPWSYIWAFGDGDSAFVEDPPPNGYPTWGIYTIQLVAYSEHCTSVIDRNIEILPPFPIPNFTGSQIGCRPVTIEFNNDSEYGVTYLWDFGDGGTSTQKDPVYTYFNVGTYTVKLTVTGPGGDLRDSVKIDSVTVFENAIAFFDFGPKSVQIPTQATNFFNFSNFASSYLWDFGDGTFSDEISPEHFYQEPGDYVITLTADNEAECPSTYTHPTTAKAQLSGEIEVPNAFTPSNSGANGGIYDPGVLSNEIFFPVLAGVAEDGYTLLIYNRWGELLFETNDIKQGWDGYFRGKLCQQDVYVWKIKAKFADGKKVVKAGDLTLLR